MNLVQTLSSVELHRLFIWFHLLNAADVLLSGGFMLSFSLNKHKLKSLLKMTFLLPAVLSVQSDGVGVLLLWLLCPVRSGDFLVLQQMVGWLVSFTSNNFRAKMVTKEEIKLRREKQQKPALINRQIFGSTASETVSSVRSLVSSL